MHRNKSAIIIACTETDASCDHNRIQGTLWQQHCTVVVNLW